MISPFLLLPFIENSFKHCRRNSRTVLDKYGYKNGRGRFFHETDKWISEKTDDQSLTAANGLANVQKRLTLLYPGDHELKMTS